MSAIINHKVYKAVHFKLKRRELAVLLRLAWYAQDDGTFKYYPSFSDLALELRCSLKTIQRSIKSLVKIGVLFLKRKYSARDNLTNQYILNIEMLDEKPVDNSVDDSCITLQTYGQFVQSPMDSLSTGTPFNTAETNELQTPIKDIYINSIVVGATNVDAPPQQPPLSNEFLETTPSRPEEDPQQEVLHYRDEWVFHEKVLPVDDNPTNKKIPKQSFGHIPIRFFGKTPMIVLNVPKHGKWATGYEDELIRLIEALSDYKMIYVPIAANRQTG